MYPIVFQRPVVLLSHHDHLQTTPLLSPGSPCLHSLEWNQYCIAKRYLDLLLTCCHSCFFQGKLLKGNDITGHLCINKAMPGMARTIYGDHQRFIDTYYKPHPGMPFKLHPSKPYFIIRHRLVRYHRAHALLPFDTVHMS